MGLSGKNTRVGCHFLLRGVFLTQGSNQSLLHWQPDSLPTEPPRKPLAVREGSLSFLSLDCDAGPRDREGASARLTCRGWSPCNWRAARGCPAGWPSWSWCGSAPAWASRQSPPPGCHFPSRGNSFCPLETMINTSGVDKWISLALRRGLAHPDSSCSHHVWNIGGALNCGQTSWLPLNLGT